jgi:uncharacterized membrane protein
MTTGYRARSGIFWTLLALPCGVLALTALLGIWRYPDMPDVLRFVLPATSPAGVLPKTPWNAFLHVILQAAITLLCVGSAWLRAAGRQALARPHPLESQEPPALQAPQALILLLALSMNCALLVTALTSWDLLQVSRGLAIRLELAPLAAWLIVAPVLRWALRAAWRAPGITGPDARRDDDRFWKWGVVYVNRDDPALLIGRRFGIGWTLNFGHPIAWIAVLALAAFIVARILTANPG